MRILAISDFDNGLKAGLIQQLKKEKPDLIVSQGDFCYGTKMRDITFSHWDEINDKNKEWYDFVSKKEAKELVKEGLDGGKKVIKSLSSIGVPVFVVYGNHEHWDYKEEDSDYYRKRFDKIIKGFKNVHSLELTNKEYDEFNFIGHGNFNSGPEYRWLTPNKFFKRWKFLRQYKSLFSCDLPNILITHNTPFNTKLDLISDTKSPRYGEHVGSKYTLKLIQKYNPVLAISGHIHETQGKVLIKNTVCVNSGAGSDGQYAIIDIKGEDIKVELTKA